MRCLRSGTLLGLALLVLVSLAAADIGPPVKVELTDVAGPARASETMTASLVIHARGDLMVSNVRCGGEGWRVISFGTPPTRMLHAGETVRLRLEAVPTDPARPLIVNLECNGRPYQRSFDLSSSTYQTARHGRPAVRIAGTASPPGSIIGVVAPAPIAERGFSKHPVDEQSAEDEVAGDPVRGQRDSYDIRVSGQFIYHIPPNDTDPMEEHGAHGVTVRVFDQDTGPDELLAVTTTSVSGYFEVTFTWDPCPFCDATPDLYVELETANVGFDVEESDIWEENYKFVTETHHDYTGTDLNVGVFSPADPSLDPALHILKTLTRGWLILYEESVCEVPHVDVQWPDNSSHSSFYNGEIHIDDAGQWHEDTLLHEWGHHWVHSFAESPQPEYCNPGDHCDEPECTHCVWCPENENVAFTEGVPDWWACYLVWRLRDLYDPDPRFLPGYELLRLCHETSQFGDPYLTEGLFSALLNDLEDATTEDHDSAVYGQDVLNLGFTTILAFIDAYHPISPYEFLDQMLAIGGPEFGEALWETAANLGFDHLDTEAPPAPVDLVCLSHQVGVPSTDPTLHMAWTRPVDDVSGIWGYAYEVSSGGPVPPGSAPVIGDVNYFITDVLPPGTYWFNIRSIDRAGHPSSDYASIGPIIVDPCNLAYWSSFDWSRPLIPHPAPDVVWGGPYVDDPLTLDGYVENTYLNIYTGNFGGGATGSSFWDHFWVDEHLVWWINWTEQPAWETMVALNRGPITVPSGRHTLHARLDDEEEVGELSEIDNFEGHQWIWSPFVIVPDSPVHLDAPPWKNAGHASITDGQTLYSNCDGFRFSQSGWWQATYLVQYDPVSDYDLKLHSPSVGASDGFGTYLASSSRTAGFLDAIIVNGNQVAWQDWDVGVTNWNYHDAVYSVLNVISEGIALDTPDTIPLNQFEMLAMREFLAGPGLYTIEVEVDLMYRPVWVAWFDSDFTMAGLSSIDGLAHTDSTGRAWLDVDLPQYGWHGIAVYRDQQDAMEPVQATLKVYPMRPELYPVTLDGWYSPLVPRPAADVTWESVPVPDILTGDTDQTWFNIAVTNDSPVEASPVAHVYLDGSTITPVSIGYPNFIGDFPLVNI
ncbi:hypothetical protein ACFL6M_07240, partial [Candidatus Eisenbacteria bacterium]